MKYSVDIIIEKGREKVIELFDNEDNMKEWMRGLKSFETTEGIPGEVGSKAKMVFEMGKREIEMIETIVKKDFPNQFVATYEAKGVYNKIINQFDEMSSDQTKYTTHQEFKFKGFMRLIAWLMPSSFKKQSMQYLNDFKKFAENA